jgi:putative ABC transport system substrate-binding protein
VNAHTAEEIDSAFETAVSGGAGGMIVGADALFNGAFKQLVAAAAHYHLPAIYVDDLVAKSGGLMSYGVDQDDNQRLVGNFAGRILKGENPADIPVQQSTKTKFVINLKTAKDLGTTVPTPLLVRADEVIE